MRFDRPKEGDRCAQPGCTGTMIVPPPVNCSCHISPPCNACTDRLLECDECGEDENAPIHDKPQTKEPNMKLTEMLEVLHVTNDGMTTEKELREALDLIIDVQDMDGATRATIVGAFRNGPLDDGDVPSKSARDFLVSAGYMAKVVVKGQEGFNALTYKGARAYRLVNRCA